MKTFLSPTVRRTAVFLLAGLTLLTIMLITSACGGSDVAAAVPTATLDPVVAAGKAVFVSDCGSCHSTAEDTVIVGPSLAGIADRAGARVDGLDDRAYLYTSILRPGDYIVDGFENVMPENFGKKLTGEEIDGVVAYLLTMHN
ncbi:MAG: cytochrome c [Chloroflexota bacterium]